MPESALCKAHMQRMKMALASDQSVPCKFMF